MHAHMGNLDALLEARVNPFSQQMETIWKFTDHLHEAVRVVHQDTSTALRRISMMISDKMPAVVGALQCDLVSSDNVMDCDEGDEGDGAREECDDDSLSHTGHRPRRHRKSP